MHAHTASLAMPLGDRRQQRSRGAAGDESAIEVSADELPSQVAERQDQVDDMEYEEHVGDEEGEVEEEEEAEGKS